MKQIKVSTNFVGFHRWPEAEGKRKYLADLHRHLFGIVVAVEVTENNRQIEYHDLLDEVNDIKNSLPIILGHDGSSCEDMAETFLDLLEEKYPARRISVEVNEDGECGSVIDNHDNF